MSYYVVVDAADDSGDQQKISYTEKRHHEMGDASCSGVRSRILHHYTYIVLSSDTMMPVKRLEYLRAAPFDEPTVAVDRTL
jgi:hypothetical protein